MWLALGLAVGVPLMLADSDRGVEYWAVYVLERSLSLDNLFVFLLVLDYFMIPRGSRLRVVRWGIVAALALRALAIAAGAALFGAFSIVSYVLGALLLLLSLRMLRGRDDTMDPGSNPGLHFIRRVVPLTPDAFSGRFVVASERRWIVTPLGLALVALAVVDLTFAVDSVSAAFGITTDFLVIWVANALALAGLVPLLALARALVRHFRYVSQTFAAILAFIALRLLTEDLVELLRSRASPASPGSSASACSRRGSRIVWQRRRSPSGPNGGRRAARSRSLRVHERVSDPHAGCERHPADRHSAATSCREGYRRRARSGRRSRGRGASRFGSGARGALCTLLRGEHASPASITSTI
jgi:TerC family integral membrane protein